MAVKEFMHSRTGAVMVGATILVALGGLGSAVAVDTIGSADIRDGAVRSVDIRDQGVMKVDVGPEAVGASELTASVKDKLNTGRVTNLEVDGPYPGLTNLIEGDNSQAMWVGDGGATLQRSWVMCMPGKVAIAGGFSPAEYSAAVMHDLQIVTSRPAQFEDGVEVGVPIAGDVDQSFVANAWLVEGFNNAVGGDDVSVRPWVVCATVK
jgi:F0F1-type ATP synthase membrane subunit c/vacuolar-type H+-ATPase subunit K